MTRSVDFGLGVGPGLDIRRQSDIVLYCLGSVVLVLVLEGDLFCQASATMARAEVSLHQHVRDTWIVYIIVCLQSVTMNSMQYLDLMIMVTSYYELPPNDNVDKGYVRCVLVYPKYFCTIKIIEKNAMRVYAIYILTIIINSMLLHHNHLNPT